MHDGDKRMSQSFIPRICDQENLVVLHALEAIGKVEDGVSDAYPLVGSVIFWAKNLLKNETS